MYIGESYPGDGYYGKSDGLHTIQYSLSNFVGRLCVQATLVHEPADEDWFTVVDLPFELINENKTGVSNIIGNYVWIRAALLEWEYGTVNSIRMNR